MNMRDIITLAEGNTMPWSGIWYHGTSGDHEDFSWSFVGSVTSGTEPGFWFTRSLTYASQYAQSAAGKRWGEPRIIEAKLDLRNPLVVHFDEDMQPVVNGEIADFSSNLDIVKFAQRSGYDSVVFPDGNFAEESEAAVVFHSDRIQIEADA